MKIRVYGAQLTAGIDLDGRVRVFEQVRVDDDSEFYAMLPDIGPVVEPTIQSTNAAQDFIQAMYAKHYGDMELNDYRAMVAELPLQPPYDAGKYVGRYEWILHQLSTATKCKIEARDHYND
jgi:hypothetical protein